MKFCSKTTHMLLHVHIISFRASLIAKPNTSAQGFQNHCLTSGLILKNDDSLLIFQQQKINSKGRKLFIQT